MTKRKIEELNLPYDPLGMNRMVYTVRSKCEEEPDMDYDDGARTLFLYTKGTEGEPPEELCQLLHYMEHTTAENAVNETLKKIHRMVEIVKRDREVSLEYMKIFEREEMLVEMGRREERQRAEAAEQELEKVKEELRKLKEERDG